MSYLSGGQLPQQTTIDQAIADGSTTVFNAAFYIPQDSDASVYVTPEGSDPDPVADLQPQGVAYNITGAGLISGFIVTFLTGYIPEDGSTVTIARTMEYANDTNFTEPINISGANLDAAFVNQELQIQQLASDLSLRTPHYAINQYLPTDNDVVPDVNLPYLSTTGDVWMKANGIIIPYNIIDGIAPPVFSEANFYDAFMSSGAQRYVRVENINYGYLDTSFIYVKGVTAIPKSAQGTSPPVVFYGYVFGKNITQNWAAGDGNGGNLDNNTIHTGWFYYVYMLVAYVDGAVNQIDFGISSTSWAFPPSFTIPAPFDDAIGIGILFPGIRSVQHDDTVSFALPVFSADISIPSWNTTPAGLGLFQPGALNASCISFFNMAATLFLTNSPSSGTAYFTIAQAGTFPVPSSRYPYGIYGGPYRVTSATINVPYISSPDTPTQLWGYGTTLGPFDVSGDCTLNGVTIDFRV